MDKISKEKVWRLIQNTRGYFEREITSHLNHPKGRNPYSHVTWIVKTGFGCSYKDIADEKYKEVVDFLNCLEKEEG